VAQANSWSLEELVLNVTVCDNVKQLKLDDCSFAITGLKLQGASCKNDVLSLSSHVSNDLPVATIKWSREQNATNANMSKINLPVYLNATRSELLFTLNLESEQNERQFYTRGVAIVASHLG